ncbi:serine hydrolase [Occallatibacter riparius]|uniref:Serine hydrolase n=1 Tax=Occallatibacter riparius TaxID=1002689 RepID=A0A9J7BUZ4_9BACT|nr:serine hydrolase [Occallatibacter riparius]UWZ84734.1 serine hydrolase [Occallatibacter riparius]
MRKFLSAIALVLFYVSLGVAQTSITPQQVLARVLQQTPAQAAWFAPVFLAQIQPAQVDAIVKQYTGTLGAFQRADATSDGFTLVMEKGTAPAKIHLDAEGRIDGLWFGAPSPSKPVSLEDAMKEISTLPGKSAALVLEEGKPLVSLHPEDALAVGSAFKLAILAAAQQQTAAGKLRLDQTFALKKEWKSLPSGVLQGWPDGTPLTLATLENEMISISDNTGADAMLSIVGRDQAEKLALRNKPFLSTREAFVLKAKSNSALLERYRKADESERRALLAEVDMQPLPETSQFSDAPTATDIEWFFTPEELCSLAAKAADATAFQINPGLANRAQWRQVAFKGGSEGGVLNMTTALMGKNGKHYCVAVTWNNDAALEQAKFFGIYGSILNTLAKSSSQ